MVCNGELAGVISYGNFCGHPMYPGVYTDIRQYRDWIDGSVAESWLHNAGVESSKIAFLLSYSWLLLFI